jgi:hypothetical protein
VDFGVFGQASIAFSQVLFSVSYIVNNIDRLAAFSASISRLEGFQGKVEAIGTAMAAPIGADAAAVRPDSILVSHADLVPPRSGRLLIRDISLEVGPNQLVSARVVQHTPARTLPMAEVKEGVRNRLIQQQSAALARKEGEARKEALAKAPTEALPVTLTLSRTQAQGAPRGVIDAVMRADASKLPVVTGVDLGTQGYVVLRVTKVVPREIPPGGDAPLQSQYTQAWAAAESLAYQEALKKRFKAEIKTAAVAEAASAALR